MAKLCVATQVWTAEVTPSPSGHFLLFACPHYPGGSLRRFPTGRQDRASLSNSSSIPLNDKVPHPVGGPVIPREPLPCPSAVSKSRPLSLSPHLCIRDHLCECRGIKGWFALTLDREYKLLWPNVCTCTLESVGPVPQHE